MKPIIEVKNISKQYQIGQKQRYLSLRDSLSDFLKFKGRNTEGSDFWALDDVSFDVQAGESIGIIGRNGAGKSTLLKILSRITPPTKGNVILRGRIASLLEVGTGFHPELTGRENVFMNGSILGLKRAEIAQKFDEIVAFSSVEQFIDTPLKHYSSGMQLRLAFAVAAHLEPEILVIDEVLAVGDAEFQKKCLGKMGEVSKSGRTVLFVSHNLSVINALCSSTICFDIGKIQKMGNTNDVIKFYNSMCYQASLSYKIGIGEYVFKNHPMKKNKNHGIHSALLLVDGEPSDVIFSGQMVELHIEHSSSREMLEPELGIVIKNSDEISIIGFNNKHVGQKFKTIKGKISKSIISIPEFPLYGKGDYSINLYLGDLGSNYEILLDAMNFELRPNDVFKSGHSLDPKYNLFFYNKISFADVND